MLVSECLGNDKGIPELRNAIRHFVKTVTICSSGCRISWTVLTMTISLHVPAKENNGSRHRASQGSNRDQHWQVSRSSVILGDSNTRNPGTCSTPKLLLSLCYSAGGHQMHQHIRHGRRSPDCIVSDRSIWMMFSLQCNQINLWFKLSKKVAKCDQEQKEDGQQL